MKIQLLIALPGQPGRSSPQVPTSVLVEDTLPAGACAALLAAQRGYPTVDATGTVLAYRLYSDVDGLALPDNRSLADLGIGAGTCLLLGCVRSQQVTLPVARPPLHPTLHEALVKRPWTRRGLFTRVLPLGGAALAGLGSGWTFALASHILALRRFGSSAQNPVQVTLREELRFGSHQQTVRTVAWSPDGRLLASGGDDAQVLVWSPGGVERTVIPHQAPVLSLAWSPEGDRLITGAASQVHFFTAVSGRELAVRSHGAQVASVAWSRTGQMLAASGSADRRVIVWQTSQYRAQTVFVGHTAAIEAVSFDASGQTIASSSRGGAVRVWAATSGVELHPFYLDSHLPIPSLAFAPQGATLVAGGSDGVMRLWDGLLCLATKASDQGHICVDVPHRLQLSTQPIQALAWSPDARYLASGHEDGTLALWRPAQSRAPVLTMTVQDTLPIHAIAWSPDGNHLAAAAGTTVTIWNLVAT